MRDQQPARARLREGRLGLGEREVAARLLLPHRERRLAEEEIGVASELDQIGVRSGVGRVGERRAAVGDAEAVRVDRVVLHPERHQLEAGDLVRHADVVLVDLERPVEHVRPPPYCPATLARYVRPPGGTCSASGGSSRPGPYIEPQTQETRSPQWSRWKWLIAIASSSGQPSRLAQLREHARAAVEQQAPGALDQVSRLGPARVGPGRRAADDGQAHARQTRGEPRLTTLLAYPPVTADSQTDPSRPEAPLANLVLSKRDRGGDDRERDRPEAVAEADRRGRRRARRRRREGGVFSRARRVRLARAPRRRPARRSRACSRRPRPRGRTSSTRS